jgi:hypothetical protein
MAWCCVVALRRPWRTCKAISLQDAVLADLGALRTLVRPVLIAAVPLTALSLQIAIASICSVKIRQARCLHTPETALDSVSGATWGGANTAATRSTWPATAATTTSFSRPSGNRIGIQSLTDLPWSSV